MFFHAGSQPSSILLIAGDVSGDVHTAALARKLLEQDPNRTLHAIGGRRLREIVAQSHDGEFLGDTTHCSAIGIVSATGIYFRCRRLADRLFEFIRSHPIDLAVLCDWGGFNGRLLPILHELKIPTLYYFPPRSWQRTGSQGLGIAPYVTRVATPFRWSAERLRSAGAEAEWVGHPSLENIWPAADRASLRMKFQVEPNDRLVALLPGSRQSEIRVLGPRLAEAATVVSRRTGAQFIAVVPRELQDEAHSHLPSWIRVVTDCAKELLVASDAAIVKTGTGTLEAVLADTPQVAVYDVSVVGRVEWCLLWAWRRIPFIAMPNIILQREAVPEFIGIHCRPQKIADAIVRILEDESVRTRILQEYKTVRQELGSELQLAATERTAQIVEEMLRPATVPLQPEPVVV